MDQIPEWFAGARLNFAENLLRYRDDRLALIATGKSCFSFLYLDNRDSLTHYGVYVQTGESGYEDRWTYARLHEQVRLCAAAMHALGVGVGDRVVAYIPNCAEAVVVMLAAASLGAIYSSTSPDFGTTVCVHPYPIHPCSITVLMR